MFRRFVNGVQVLVAGAAVVTVVLLLTVSPTVAVIETPDAAAGAELFQARCGGCHGPQGEGGVGPALAGGLSRFESVEEVGGFISAGVPGRMPGFETRLGPDEINAIAQHAWAELAGR
jgi:mono/diheme cytochrome c family protein